MSLSYGVSIAFPPVSSVFSKSLMTSWLEIPIAAMATDGFVYCFWRSCLTVTDSLMSSSCKFSESCFQTGHLSSSVLLLDFDSASSSPRLSPICNDFIELLRPALYGSRAWGCDEEFDMAEESPSQGLSSLRRSSQILPSASSSAKRWSSSDYAPPSEENFGL